MANPFEEPFAKPKQRKPGVAGLVGDMYGEKAKAAYAKRVSEGKKPRLAPQENWEGADITMSAKEKAGMEIERTHVRLQNIPTFTKLPDEDTIKKDFNVGWIWNEEYRADRSLTDFRLTETDCEDLGLREHERFPILEAMAKAKETPPLAMVFDIGDIIKQKQQANPKHPNTLTTKEVLEAIDAAGYRPATLQELLAYGRDHWKPDIDLEDLTEEERERLHLANAPYIFALGASFSSSGGRRHVPCLSWDSQGRGLDARGFGNALNSDYNFLVFRKGSS